MSTRQQIRRESDAIYQESLKEEGTHAAWLRGYAAGILRGAERVQQARDYEEIVSTIKRKK